MPLNPPLGSPFRLIEHQRSGAIALPTRQDVAIVICGGGDPFAEFKRATDMCFEVEKPYTIFAGNDMIAEFCGHMQNALTLHPDKIGHWLGKRRANGFEPPDKIWSHRPFTGVSDWTRDWAGSTGLFCVKVARELGFVHVMLCGVHMSIESDHFVRKAPWKNAIGFRRGWEMRWPALRPYVKSFGGWTKENLGEPTIEWLREDIEDKHRQHAPPTHNRGQTA